MSIHDRILVRGLPSEDASVLGSSTVVLCLSAVQLIRESLLPDSTSTSSSGNNSAAQPTAGPAEQQQQLPDALSTYSGGPVFIVTDMKSTGDAASNIATMPSAPFLYGVSIGICMSSATSEPGGAGLGTVGWHEVSPGLMSAAF